MDSLSVTSLYFAEKNHGNHAAIFAFAEKLFHGHTSHRFESDAIKIRNRARKARKIRIEEIPISNAG